MRLTHESLELLKLQQIKLTGEVFDRSRQELYRLQQQAHRSGPARAAVGRLYVQMIGEIVDAKAQGYLAAFRRERLIPTEDDIQEITDDLVKAAHGIWYGQGHQPFPEAHNDFETIVPRARLTLIVAVKEMMLDAKAMERAAPAPTLPPRSPETSTDPPADLDQDALSVNDVDVLELKPNFFGIGLNINHLIKRVAGWWKRRKDRAT